MVQLLGMSTPAVALNNLYTIDPTKVNTEAVTTPVVEDTSMGGCTCDLTLNSCDTYCCCDTDCP